MTGSNEYFAREGKKKRDAKLHAEILGGDALSEAARVNMRRRAEQLGLSAEEAAKLYGEGEGDAGRASEES